MGRFFWHSCNGGAFCFADIVCSASRQLKPIEKLVLMLCTFDEFYSVIWRWNDSDKKMKVYSSINIEAPSALRIFLVGN
jgi:hypothetical protein